MKKTIIFLLVCAAVLAFAACGDKGKQVKTTTPVQEPSSEQAAGDTTGKEDTTIPGEQGVEDSIFDGPSQGVERTEPAEESTDAETTNPQEQETEATVPSPTEDEPLTYEQWLELTPAQQRQYEESFPTRDAFFDWYEAAKKAYDEANPPIEIGNGSIDMSTIPT